MNPDAVGVHPVVGALDGVCDALAGAQQVALFGLTDGDVEAAIERCEHARAHTFGTSLALVGEAHSRNLGRSLGAASTAAWLRDRFRIRPGDAKRLVELAGVIRVGAGPVDYAANVGATAGGRVMPATAAALADGVISPEHVAVVGKVMRNLPDGISIDQARAAEADLASFSREHDPHTVAKLGDYLLGLLEADTLDEDEDHRHRMRELRLDDTSGRLTGRITLEDMATLRTALEPLAAPNPADDGTPDPRTAGQRMADALVELARRYLATDNHHTNHGLSHRVMVLIGLDTLTHDHTHTTTGAGAGDDRDAARSTASATDRDAAGVSDATSDGHRTADNGDGDTDGSGPDHGAPDRGGPDSGGPDRGGPGGGGPGGGGPAGGVCPIEQSRDAGLLAPPGHHPTPAELVWGGAITAGTARRIACAAGIQRIILDPAGAVLDVGREHRTVTPAQFAALIARDGGCTFPGCTRPPAWCQAHHITHWTDGGRSDLDNYALLCGYHHRLIHHDHWQIRTSPDRHPEFIPPRWIDPNQHPRRNNRPRHHHTRHAPTRKPDG